MAELGAKRPVTVGGRNVWCRIAGTGPSILILPGWGGPTENYFPLQDKLAANGYSVILPDLPGLPGKTDSLVMPLDGWSDWIDELAVAAAARPVVLVSHSLSARIALQYMAKHGSHCRCSVIVDPWVVSSSLQAFLCRSVARVVRFLCPVVYPDMRWVKDSQAWANALRLFAAVRHKTTVPCLVLSGRRDVARLLFTGYRRIGCDARQYDWGHSPQVTAVSQLASIIDELIRSTALTPDLVRPKADS